MSRDRKKQITAAHFMKEADRIDCSAAIQEVI